MTAEELIARACPTIGEMGWAFYFTPETAARGEKLGLDVFEFYFLGRGGVLGDVEWQVVASAFGYFKPSVVEFMWNQGKTHLDPREAAREFLGACHDFGRQHFSAVDALDGFCDAAELVVAAADATACPLFAGLAAEPLAEDLPARAMQLITTLREFRGGVHLISVIAAGLRPLSAHYLRRPEMMAVFGWAEEDTPSVTDEDRAKLAIADEVTASLVLPAYGVLDRAGRDALAAGLDRMDAVLALAATPGA